MLKKPDKTRKVTFGATLYYVVGLMKYRMGNEIGFSWMLLPHHKYRENPDFLQIPENLLTGFKTQYVRLLIVESKNKKGNPNGLPKIEYKD